MLKHPESVHEVEGLSSHAKDILTEARKAIVQRPLQYGSPAINFDRAAAIATIILEDKLKPGYWVTPTDWVLLMALALKGSRLIENPHHADTQIDLVGYATLLSEL